MPIYEYRAVDSHGGCERCQNGVDIIQAIQEEPLTACPQCHAPVARVLSAPHLRVGRGGRNPVEDRVREYEKQGMYSHAAELADKEAEKTKREDLKARALDNYKRAGYKNLL